VISITQATELVLSIPLKKSKPSQGMLINMICCFTLTRAPGNAAAALDVHLSDISTDVGVDVLSFGGAKNGLMVGEAVIFFKRSFLKI
jgi:threonine aldolase